MAGLEGFHRRRLRRTSFPPWGRGICRGIPSQEEEGGGEGGTPGGASLPKSPPARAADWAGRRRCCSRALLGAARPPASSSPPPEFVLGLRTPPRHSGTAAREMEGYGLFLALLSSALLLGFLSVIFALVWVLHYREGLAWDGGAAEFNWHPVLMLTGFVFVQGIAIIVYRLPWTWKCSKVLMKLIHAGLNTIALTLAIISLVAVFDFHNIAKIPNMYSLHSWIGLIAIILYSLQLVLGFVIFLLPFAPIHLRAMLMPIHVYSGLFIFGTVIASVLMGITEKLIFALKAPAYKDSPEEATFVNTLGVLVVVFGGTILWMVTRPHWKRPLEPNSKIQQKIGGRHEGNEEGATMKDCKDTDNSDLEFRNEAREQNLNPDDAGQRSTM